MAKKKKNSNYATEKRANAASERESREKALALRNKILAIAIPALILVAIIVPLVVFGVVNGWYARKPVATKHVLITFDNGATAHVELYGNDAPEAVEAFLALAKAGTYNGSFIESYNDGVVGMTDIKSSKSIKGEYFDGDKNVIRHKKGTLALVIEEGKETSNGEFVIHTKANNDLNGNSAAFGRITEGTVALIDMLKDAELDENGNLIPGARPKIVSISEHDSH